MTHRLNVLLRRNALISARLLEGRDEKPLTELERKQVALLEELNYLIPNNPPNGYVGKARNVRKPKTRT